MSKTAKRKLGIGVGAVLLLALLTVAAVLLLSGGTATAKQIATLHIFDGQVEVGRGGAFTDGSEGQALREGDTVRTGVDGRAEIGYFDGSLTRLDFGTSFQLTTLEAVENDAGSKVIEASQSAGGTYNRVTDLTDSESRFDIDTPTATASVQGTIYAVLVGDDGSTTIAVIEGVVTATSDSEAIDVPAGKMVVVGADGSLGELQDIPEDLLNSDFIVFNQCDLDQVRDCVLGAVVTPEEPEAEPSETPAAEPSASSSPSAGAPTPDGGGGEPQNHDPQAGLVVSGSAGPAPLTVSFADASTDPDGDALSRHWSFGDGGSHSGGQLLLHTYTEPGDYVATLTVMDPDGASDAVAALIQVVDGEAPVLTITGGPSDPSDSADASFEFTSSEAGTGFFCSLDGAAATACGDGSAGVLGILQRIAAAVPESASGSASYSGLSDGPHDFTVSVTDDAGNTGSASWDWTIDTVTLDHIIISPSSSTIVLGESRSYSATAYDTNGVSMGSVTADTTFSGANCSGNVCSPTSVGDHTVIGSYQGETDTAVLHVIEPGGGGEEPVFDHIVISPTSATITYGESQTYDAIAVDSDGASMGDVTADTMFTGANCTGNVCTPTSAGPKTVTGTYAGALGSDHDSASLTVNQAPLHVTGDDQDLIYGDADPEFTFAYDGFVGEDGAGDVDTAPTCGVTGDHQHVGTYPITCSGGVDDNYAFSYSHGTLTVHQAQLTVMADDKAKVQGTANPALTFGISGFAYGETESVLDTLPTCTTTAITLSPVGDYPITCSGGADGDYAFSYQPGTLTVTARPVTTVTPDDQTITYGDPEPTFTFGYSPAPVGTIDTPPTCGVVPDENYPGAGTYPIECSGASDDIYDFSYDAGSLTIEKKVLSVIPDDLTIDEGVTPIFTVSYESFVGEDGPGDIDTPPTCDAYPIEEGGTARPVATVSEGGFAAGEYAIYCSEASDDNYDFTYEAIGTLTVLGSGPGEADHIELTGSLGLSVECTRTYTATLYDADDNVVDDDSTVVTVVDNDPGGNVSFPDGNTSTATNGVATIDVTGNHNGSVKLQASAGDLVSDELHFTVDPYGCGSETSAPVSHTRGGTGSSSASGEPSDGDRSRESGFRSLGLVIVLPLLGLRRRRRH